MLLNIQPNCVLSHFIAVDHLVLWLEKLLKMAWKDVYKWDVNLIQTLREEIQKEYRSVVERRVFTGMLSQTLNTVRVSCSQLHFSLIISFICCANI